MTPAEIARLENLAREATPGEWKVSTRRPFIVAVDHVGVAECFGPPPSGDIANAAYIAAANPAAVLALIERVRELEADAARFRWLIKGAGSHCATGEDWYLSAIQWTSQNRRETMRDAIDQAMEWDKP